MFAFCSTQEANQALLMRIQQGVVSGLVSNTVDSVEVLNPVFLQNVPQ